MADAFTKWTTGTVAEDNVIPLRPQGNAFTKWNTNDPSPALEQAVGVNPDEEAKKKKLAQESGFPEEAVAADPGRIEKYVRKQQIDNLVKDAPITREWLSDPLNARISHDDVENLTTVEDTWTTSNVLTGMSEAAQRSLAGIGDFALSLAQDLEKNPNRQLGPIESYIKDTFTDWSKLNNQPGHYVPSLTWDEMNESVFNWINPLKLAQYGGERAITSIPSMVEAVFSPGTFTMGLIGDIAQTRAKNEGRGEATTGDMLKALPAAVISAQLERLGAIKLFSGNPFKGIFGEGVTEAGESLTENVGATVGTEKGFDAPTAAIATLQGFVDGILAGGVQRGTVDVYLKAVDKLRQTTTAKVFEQRLNKTQEALAASAVVPRAPDVAVNHLASVMKEAGTKSVLLSVEGINELANKLELSPIDVAKQLGVRPQYEREYLRGGNIELSPEQLGSLMLDENWSALSGHIRENEDAFTTKEAEEYETSGLKEEIAASLTVAEDSGIPVFHGSRHEFEAFKREGTALTGEGGQAFGAGVYVAEARQVAEFYKSSTLDQVDFSNLPPELEAKYGKQLDQFNKQLDDLAAEYSVPPKLYANAADYQKESQAIWNERNDLQQKILKEYKDTYGRLYEARLDVTDDELVLFDEPFEKQPEKVKIAFKKAFEDAEELVSKESFLSEAKRVAEIAETGKAPPSKLDETMTAENIFREMEVMVGTDDASKLLEKYGVAGIKFRDNFSRNRADAHDRIDQLYRLIDTEKAIKENLASRLVDQPPKVKKELTEKLKNFDKRIEDYKKEIVELQKGPTHNYVVFDPNRLRIIKKNDIPITQAEIDVTAIEQELGTDGLFTTSEEAGMTPNEYMFYLASLKKAHDAAVNRQNEKLLKDAQRKVNKEYKVIKKDMKESVRESLANSPVYQAINSIQKDRLDRAILADLLGGEKFLDSLPKQSKGRPIYTNKDETGGLDPSAVAEAYGFPSATDMVLAMLTAKPFEEAVETTTQQMMQRNYPDLSNAKARLDEALESLHNDYTGEVLTQELNRLRELAAIEKAEKADKSVKKSEKQEGEKKPQTEAQKQAQKVKHIKLQVMKAAVKKQLDQTQIKDIRVGKFVKTAKDQGKLAGKLLRKGDIDGAIDSKFKQLTNFIMAQQAYKVKAEVEKQNHYLSKFNTSHPPKIGTDFISSIRQMLGNYNLGPKLTDKSRKRLLDWVAKKEAEGALFQMPPRLLADKQVQWQDLPLAEWRTLVEGVKNIEAQGRNERVLGKVGKEVDFAHSKSILLSTVSKMPSTARAAWMNQGKYERQRDKAAGSLAYVDGALVKVENLLRYLDGGSVGEWYKRMFQPTSEAQTQQLDMVTNEVVPLVQKLNKLPKEVKKRLERKVFVKSLNQEMTHSELLMLALNSGNASNLEKVIEGHNSTLPKNPINGQPQGFLWTYQGVLDAMALLSPSEAHWVQEVWDYLESLRPAVEAVYEAENGIAAQRVEARAITIGGVKVKGGYFPMMYKYSPAHETALGALQDSAIRASVYSGMTKERTGFVAPVQLDIQQLLPAIERNIHFITHYRAVRDNLRILQDNDLVNAIRDKLGEPYVQELKNWTEAVASGNMIGHSPTYVDKTTEFFRRGFTAAVLGISWTTGVSQVFGYSSSVAVLGRSSKGEAFSSARGIKYMGIGVQKYLMEPGSVKQAKLLSGELRHRLANTDRELSDALNAARKKYGAIGQTAAFRNWWNKQTLTVISGIQTYTVDIPTWIGAFNQGLDDGMNTEDAVQHADSILRTSQGTGHVKDLSAIQRKRGVTRALTMFSTYSLVLYNMQRESVLAGKKFPISSFARMMWAITIPAMMDAVLRADGGPDEDEEETWAGWFTKKLAGYSARSVPLIGTGIASYMEGYSYRASPLEAIPANVMKALSALENWEDEDDWKKAEALIMGFGTLLGIGGTTQAARFADAMSTDDPTLNDYLLGVKGDE